MKNNNHINFTVCSYIKKEFEAVLPLVDAQNIFLSTFKANPLNPYKPGCDLLNEIVPVFPKCDFHFILGGCCISDKMMTEFNKNKDSYFCHQLRSCLSLFIPQSLADRLISQGASIIYPGMLSSWKQYLVELGFDQKMLKQYYRESTKKIVFLETGLYEHTQQNLIEFTEQIGIPYEIIEVDMDYLKSRIWEIVVELNEHER